MFCGFEIVSYQQPTRCMVFENLGPLVQQECPLVNLPETNKVRWDEGLTADEMRKCIWVQPKLVAQIEFVELTGSDHLDIRSPPGSGDDKDARRVGQE